MATKGARTCVACGASSTKQDLIRFVAKDGAVSVDEGGRAPGRGAYLCAKASCLEAARKRRSLDRALRTRIDEADQSRLEQEFVHAVRRHSDAQ